jgi:hypothetical protein
MSKAVSGAAAAKAPGATVRDEEEAGPPGYHMDTVVNHERFEQNATITITCAEAGLLCLSLLLMASLGIWTLVKSRKYLAISYEPMVQNENFGDLTLPCSLAAMFCVSVLGEAIKRKFEVQLPSLLKECFVAVSIALLLHEFGYAA